MIFREGRIVLHDKKNLSPEMRHIDYGLSIATAPVLRRYGEGENFDLASVYGNLARRGELAGFEVTERFYEIGSFGGLRETENFFGGERGGERHGSRRDGF